MTAGDWEHLSAEEWKGKAYAGFVENVRRQDALERAELAERGEVMLEFIPADATEDFRGDDFQGGLAEVGKALTVHEVAFKRRVMTFDSADCGGFALPEFVIALKELGMVAITGVSAVAAAWVQGRNGRKADFQYLTKGRR